MPYEARQPSVFAEMVPIHAKLFALKDGRKDNLLCLSVPMQKGILLYLDTIIRVYQILQVRKSLEEGEQLDYFRKR